MTIAVAMFVFFSFTSNKELSVTFNETWDLQINVTLNSLCLPHTQMSACWRALWKWSVTAEWVGVVLHCVVSGTGWHVVNDAGEGITLCVLTGVALCGQQDGRLWHTPAAICHGDMIRDDTARGHYTHGSVFVCKLQFPVGINGSWQQLGKKGKGQTLLRDDRREKRMISKYEKWC